MNASKEITKLQKIILKLAEEVQEQIDNEDDDEVEESTTTGNADGYQTPFAFSGNRKKDKEKKDQIIKAGGYKRVNEAIKDYNPGDTVRVVSMNKSGIVLTQYGRKVHVKFPNGSEKTVDHNDLEMINNEATTYGSSDPESVAKSNPKIKAVLAHVNKGHDTEAEAAYNKLNSKEKDFMGTFYKSELQFIFGESINEMGSYQDVKKRAQELIKQMKDVESKLKDNPTDSKLKSQLSDIKKKLVSVARDVKKNESVSESSLGKMSISDLSKKSKIFNKFKKHVEDDLEGYIDDVISGQGKDVVVYYSDNSGNVTKRGLTKRLTLENYIPYQQDTAPTNRRNDLRKGEGTPNQKLGVGIREVRKQLSEIEKFLRWYKEIKNESDMGSDQYWKRTQTHLMKIKERVVNIAKSIKELDN